MYQTMKEIKKKERVCIWCADPYCERRTDLTGSPLLCIECYLSVKELGR